jgi:hypothetical protein
MLSEAFAKAKTTDPVKVAATMDGMKFKSFNGDVEMRKTDHQMQQGLYISVWQKAGRQVPDRRREHRLHLRAGQVLRALRGQHADLLPDEASLRYWRAGAASGRPGQSPARAFFLRIESKLCRSSSPSRC